MTARDARRRLGTAAVILMCPLLVAGCAGFGPAFGKGSARPAVAAVPAPEPAPVEVVEAAEAMDAAPGHADPVDEAEALIQGGQVDAALALLKRTVDDGTARAEDALYWIAVLSFAPPIADPAQGRAALERLVTEFPDGHRRHEAAALKALADEGDRLQADNGALKEDLQKLLNIDVEAQRQRRGATTP